ncbi:MULTISPECIES: metallophosphoesterase family protein [unclassified Pseudoclavibacter]|uniref:metallophosphoesterase family protein n=1 Tax=unclassified Pseudoclavibacter TaxID=2615177 RepID=UPI001BA76792|nr:metallophosphoesterase [Pseudoclavibacter sp. Marseille-Q4354]MBS3177416.1 metallophosphoesterase [Pseudoclavibacter sp. Marseille-Q4354]
MSDEIGLLCKPYLLLPDETGVEVAWVTDRRPRASRLVFAPWELADRLEQLSPDELLDASIGGELPAAVRVQAASTRLSAMAEDRESMLPARLVDLRLALQSGETSGVTVPREVWRIAARATGLEPGRAYAYRVASSGVASDVARLSAAPPADSPSLRLLLTSDHQLGATVPATMQQAIAATGGFDAVLYAGDFVNVPDRASEWFDDARGSAFFPSMRGILPDTPMLSVVGNHEVQGMREAGATLAESFESALPLAVSPDGLSLSIYEMLFPSPSGSRFFAITFGGVRIIALSAARVWRSDRAEEHPEDRVASSRYQESRDVLDDPLAQRYGSHIIDDLSAGSPQYNWLRRELRSPEFAEARLRIVVMHESPHSIGVNAMPHFAHPVRLEERDATGQVTGVRYDYPSSENILLRDVAPLLEAAGVELVIGGHSHLWSRFTSPAGVHYLETSHAGSTHGAFASGGGRQRARPPRLWNAHDALAQGDPGGLTPIVPNIRPRLGPEDQPLPYVADPELSVFSVLTASADAGAEVSSYVVDSRSPDAPAQLFDAFPLG